MPKFYVPRRGAARIKPYTGGKRRSRASVLGDNLTSRPAGRGKKGGNGEFGTPREKPEGPSRRGHLYGAYAGLLGGTVAGTGAGTVAGRIKHPESKKFKETVGKRGGGSFHLITDVGTKAGRKPPRWPLFPGKTIAGAGAAGGALGYTSAVAQKKEQAAYVKQQQRKKTITKKYEKVADPWPKNDRKNKKGFGSQGDVAAYQQRYKQNMSMKPGAKHGKENRQIQRNATAGGAAVGAAAGAGLAHRLVKEPYKQAMKGTHPAYRKAVRNRYGAAAGVLAAGTTLMGTGYGTVVGGTRRSVRAQKRSLGESYRAGEIRKPKKHEKIEWNGVIKMDSTSAFGVDHAISKSAVDPSTGKKPTLGRRAVASTPYAELVHPFVAGKKGKKLRSAGNQIGGGVAGGIVGGTAAGIGTALATRGRSVKATKTVSSIGGMTGAVGGTQLGLNRNQRKGYLKPQS